MFGLLPLIGGMLSGGAKGQAAERGGQNNFNLSQDVLRDRQYGTQQSALLQLLGLLEAGQLQRARIGLDAPGQRTRQAILGSLLQNIQPFSVSPPPGVRMGNIQGGMSPALLNPQARQAGGELQRQALQALISRSDVPAMPDTSRTILAPPQLSPYRQAGKGESIMSLLGLGLSGLGAFQPRVGTTPPYWPQGAG